MAGGSFMSQYLSKFFSKISPFQYYLTYIYFALLRMQCKITKKQSRTVEIINKSLEWYIEWEYYKLQGPFALLLSRLQNKPTRRKHSARLYTVQDKWLCSQTKRNGRALPTQTLCCSRIINIWVMLKHTMYSYRTKEGATNWQTEF